MAWFTNLGTKLDIAKVISIAATVAGGLRGKILWL